MDMINLPQLTKCKAILGLVALIGGGIWAAETHYAIASQVQQQIQSLQTIVVGIQVNGLKAERRRLEGERYRMRSERAQGRTLTALEEQRLIYLDLEIRDLTEQIRVLMMRVK